MPDIKVKQDPLETFDVAVPGKINVGLDPIRTESDVNVSGVPSSVEVTHNVDPALISAILGRWDELRREGISAGNQVLGRTGLGALAGGGIGAALPADDTKQRLRRALMGSLLGGSAGLASFSVAPISYNSRGTSADELPTQKEGGAEDRATAAGRWLDDKMLALGQGLEVGTGVLRNVQSGAGKVANVGMAPLRLAGRAATLPYTLPYRGARAAHGFATDKLSDLLLMLSGQKSRMDQDMAFYGKPAPGRGPIDHGPDQPEPFSVDWGTAAKGAAGGAAIGAGLGALSRQNTVKKMLINALVGGGLGAAVGAGYSALYKNAPPNDGRLREGDS